MTAAQLTSYALARVLSADIKFDTEDAMCKVLYLGQHGKEHFFVFSLSPIDAFNCINVKPIKGICQILDQIGFVDLHWSHLDAEYADKYFYYMSISDDEMQNIPFK